MIEVEVKEGNNKPYYLNGIAYKRVGTENVVIPPCGIGKNIFREEEKILGFRDL